MNWQDHIESNPDIMLGKPVIKGTRITVEHVLERLACGATSEYLLENHPRLTQDDIQACLQLSYEVFTEGSTLIQKVS